MPAFTSLGAALGGVVGRLGLSAKLVEQRLARDWPVIVGEHVAAHTRPDAIRFKKLSLIARNSIWVQQLSFLKGDLLAKINAAAGQEIITDIMLRVGEMRENATERQADHHDESPPTPPTAALLAEAARHAERIADDELRRRFTDVMARALAVRGSSSRRRSVL